MRKCTSADYSPIIPSMILETCISNTNISGQCNVRSSVGRPTGGLLGWEVLGTSGLTNREVGLKKNSILYLYVFLYFNVCADPIFDPISILEA